MKSLFKVLALLLVGMSVAAHADGVFISGSTNGNTATDVFIKSDNGPTEVTDLAASVTASRETALLELYVFKSADYNLLGSTTSNLTVNTTNGYAVNDFVILSRSTKPFVELRKIIAIGAATNLTVDPAPTTTQTVGQVFWKVGTPTQRWFANISQTNSTAEVNGKVSLWFPGGGVSAIRLTNSAASQTRLSVSGKTTK